MNELVNVDIDQNYIALELLRFLIIICHIKNEISIGNGKRLLHNVSVHHKQVKP